MAASCAFRWRASTRAKRSTGSKPGYGAGWNGPPNIGKPCAARHPPLVREWRHQSESTHRPHYFPRPEDDRRIIRRKSFTLAACTVDEAAVEMDLLDYEFHMFTEKGTGFASVLYRAGPRGYRLAQVTPASPELLASFKLPLTISPQPVPCLTVEQATDRLGLLGLPFLFFIVLPRAAPACCTPATTGITG